MKNITPNVKKSCHRLESSIESACVKKAKQREWITAKLGNQGNPDRIFIKNGRVIFVEFKTMTGKLSPRQIVVHKMYFFKGIEIYICRSVEDFEEILNVNEK